MASSQGIQSLRSIVASINKDNGPGTVILGSELNYDNIPRITSGSLSLDVILGGGWPTNQWHEIYGEFSSGKTAVVLQTIAANQRIDPTWCVWWLAAEHFEPGYARLCGVDLRRVYVHDTNVMEAGFQKILDAAATREIDAVVIDSLPALIPSREDDNDAGDLAPGLSALLNNQFFSRKAPRAFKRSLTEIERPITGFAINQFREKIGVLHGDPRTTPGGKGKDFAYFTRVELRRDDWIKDGPEPVGMTIKATTRKNKSHRPQRVATFDFYVSEVDGHPAGAYDNIGEVVDVGIAYKVITVAGSMYYYDGQGFRGRPGLKDAVRSNEKLRLAISEDVIRVAVHGEALLIPEPEPAPPVPAKKTPATKKATRPRATARASA